MSNSFNAVIWAIGARGLTAGEFRVLIALANRVNKRTFNVWPSYRLLARNTELSLASVRRHIASLEAKGFIVVIERTRDTGAQSSNLYQLQVRSRHSYPDDIDVSIEPDDEDDGDDDVDAFPIDRPRAQSEQGHAQSEQGALLTAEHGSEPSQYGTFPSEVSPKPPEGGDTDLFGEKIKPQLMTDAEIAEAWTASWNAMAAGVPRIDPIVRMGAERVKELATRIDDHAENRTADAVQVVIRTIVERIAGNLWLRGEALKGGWPAPAAWATKKANFNKIMEGFYEQDYQGGSAASAHGGGSRNAEARQAALELLRARRGATR